MSGTDTDIFFLPRKVALPWLLMDFWPCLKRLNVGWEIAMECNFDGWVEDRFPVIKLSCSWNRCCNLLSNCLFFFAFRQDFFLVLANWKKWNQAEIKGGFVQSLNLPRSLFSLCIWKAISSMSNCISNYNAPPTICHQQDLPFEDVHTLIDINGYVHQCIIGLGFFAVPLLQFLYCYDLFYCLLICFVAGHIFGGCFTFLFWLLIEL